MAQYDIRPLQLRVLEILLAVDKACKTHGLRYYIVAGTLLGAVRHKGFIPWDDDLDIAMPRADYDKLIAHCKEYLPEQFEMICGENDAVYPLPFAKIQDAHTTIIERMHKINASAVFFIFVWTYQTAKATPHNCRMRREVV